MFEGVYCKENNSNAVHESILIDSFNNSINSALNPQSCENLSDSRSVEMNPESGSISDSKTTGEVLVPLESCVAGTNVRATYTADGKLYEAVVKNLFGRPPNIMARVRYHGYGNEETISVKMIFPSLGSNAIQEQIERAKLEDEQTDESTQNIHWKKGMACRALYEEKDIIYEATVLEVNESERTAYVEMLGYGTSFNTKFEKMYESIPALRKKQAEFAQKYFDEAEKQRKNTRNCGGDQPSPDPVVMGSEALPGESKPKSTDFDKVDAIAEVSKELEPDEDEKVQSSETNDEGLLKKNESNCTNLKLDVTAETSKEPQLKCINEKEPSFEALASGGTFIGENESNCSDGTEVDGSGDTSTEPRVMSIDEKVPSFQTLISDGDHLKENKSNHTDFGTEPKLDNSSSQSIDVRDSHLPLSLSSEEIMQPENESEALACLLSANYLSGYYAGYYDCIRRRQNSDKSEC